MADSSFPVDTPAWDETEMMMEDNGSVIDGVVDDDFLMMLDDEEASLSGDDSLNDQPQFTLGDNDLNLDLTETNHDEEDDFAPEAPVVSHHFPSSPTRGVQRHFSEGIMPSQRSFPSNGFHQQQLQSPQPSQPQRGVSRHFSERIPEPRRGVSRHFSERIPERIPESTPSFYNQHQGFHQQEAPRSPVPNEINIFSNTLPHETQARQAPTFRVTPEASNSSISLPDPYALQMQYQRTLQRLGKSMRRSDATRSIVKRQRSGYSTCSNISTESESFQAFPGEQVEEARRRLFQLTQQG